MHWPQETCVREGEKQRDRETERERDWFLPLTGRSVLISVRRRGANTRTHIKLTCERGRQRREGWSTDREEDGRNGRGRDREREGREREVSVAILIVDIYSLTN